MRGTPSIALALGLSCLACAGNPERTSVPDDPATGSGAEAGGESTATLAARQTPADAASTGTPRRVVAPQPLEGGDATADQAANPSAQALADAFAERLTVSRRHDGTRVLTPHCRNGPVPCEDRLLAFATLIVELAEEHDVDPLLIAAMALKESGLDPSALGRRREAGIVQLHPRGAGRGVRYVQDAAYRARCQSRVDACQREVLVRGITTLVRGMAECGGLRGGLGAYASGHCTTSVRYIERVLEERGRLRRLVRDQAR